jgi:hypothetical protein
MSSYPEAASASRFTPPSLWQGGPTAGRMSSSGSSCEVRSARSQGVRHAIGQGDPAPAPNAGDQDRATRPDNPPTPTSTPAQPTTWTPRTRTSSGAGPGSHEARAGLRLRDGGRAARCTPARATYVPHATAIQGEPRSLTGTREPVTTTGVPAGHPRCSTTDLPSWSCRFDPGRPLHIRPAQGLSSQQKPDMKWPPWHTCAT